MSKKAKMLAPADGGHAGVVYTKQWVVELILDLAGYTPDKRLFEQVAVEPSAGDGAFLLGMIRRLTESCSRHQVALDTAADALRAYEIDSKAVAKAVDSVAAELGKLGHPPTLSRQLASQWIRHEDFLDASLQFPSADVIAGNPPYIRLEEIPEDKAEMYRNTYRTMRGRADLYVAFYEAALAQLRPGGICAFICADRWMLNDYGSSLREFITGAYNVQYLIDAHDVDAFEAEVSAYPAITVISASTQGGVVVGKALPGIENRTTGDVAEDIKLVRPSPTLRVGKFDDWFEGDDPWPCSSPESLSLLRNLESRFPTLEVAGDTVVGIGVASGADEVYVTRGKPDIEDDRALPLAMASDLQDGRVDWSGHYLVNPWNEDGLIDLPKYPKLAAYLEPHRASLAARHTAKGRPHVWHKTIDRVNLSLLRQPKLYIPDIKDRLSPSLDQGNTYPHHNVYWITSKSWDLRVLGGLLMSSVAEFFIRSYGVKMRGGFFRFQAQYLRRIRVPAPNTIPAHQARQLVTAFETQNVALANEVAFQIYGITAIPRAA